MRHRARIAYFAARGDLLALGWWLRRSLSVEHRRRLGLILLRDEPLTLRFEGDGFAWEVPVGDEITRTLFASGGFATAQIEALCSRFETGTLLEIGANVGTTTLPFARHGWDVIAVEPVPALHRFLAANVERNGLSDRVTLVEAAVARAKGRATMVLPVGMYGSSHIEGHLPIHTASEYVEVDTLPLDEIVGDRDVSLVWCDAEGSEGIVIESGVRLWERGVSLYVELMAKNAPAAREHFRSFCIDATGETRPIEELEDADVDVLLLP